MTFHQCLAFPSMLGMDRCHIIIGFRDGLALGENSPDDSQDKE